MPQEPVSLGLTYPSSWPQYAQVGASLGVAVAQGIGSWRQNYENRKLAREQMAFQERMSNTSYQRAMHDMRLSGINPMLAYMQGGASSPGGATANMENVLGTAASSASHVYRMAEELKGMRAQRELMDSQRRREDAQEELTSKQSQNVGLQNRLLGYDIPRASADAAAADSRLGRAMSYVRQLFPSGPLNPLSIGRR